MTYRPPLVGRVTICQKPRKIKILQGGHIIWGILTRIVARQACSSHCNLDSRIGRRQCCLIVAGHTNGHGYQPNIHYEVAGQLYFKEAETIFSK